MVTTATARLQIGLAEHRRVFASLSTLLDEMEKSWMIKVTKPTESAVMVTDGKVAGETEPQWRSPTVGWLANHKHFQPMLLPKMQDARSHASGVFESPDDYFTTILKLWVGMTFIDGNNALLPHCTAKSNEKVCDQPLWPFPHKGGAPVPCRNPKCHRNATFLCSNRYHNVGYCSGCAGELQKRLRGPPSSRASTNIYDGTITSVKHDGTISIEQVKSRRPPQKEIHWRTTKRLASPNLVAVVMIASREASLRESDDIYWAQIVFQGQSFDEYKARERGCLTFRLLEYRDEPGNLMMTKNPRAGDALVIIDCQTFVPEFVPVLKALEMQSRLPVPFRNGALLNIRIGDEGDHSESLETYLDSGDAGDADSDSSSGMTSLADMSSRYSSSDELICHLIQVSCLAPIIDIRRDSALSDQLQRALVSLVRSTTLDSGQLISFVEALIHPVHCTQGPPGTGKSYLGVVVVRALLAVRDLWKIKNCEVGDPPILVLSYKNHAIDEFLLDLVHAEPKLNHARMRFNGRFYGNTFRRLIRIGGGCSEPELQQYAERNATFADPAVRRLSSEIDDAHKFLENWQKFRDDFLPILETHSMVSTTTTTGPGSDFRKAVVRVVPTLSDVISTILSVRALLHSMDDDDASDGDAVEDDSSQSNVDSPDNVLVRLEDALVEVTGMSNADFHTLHDGIKHYDADIPSAEVLFQWLVGFRPLPACATDGCSGICRDDSVFCNDHSCQLEVDGVACCSEVVKDQCFCSAHLCQAQGCANVRVESSRFCIDHSCTFLADGKLCCDEVMRKRIYCKAHLCSSDGCKDAKVASNQHFCTEHACFVCIQNGEVAEEAVDAPPRNSCDRHPLCWGMNGDEMCVELASSGSSYCPDHEEVLYCKWSAAGTPRCKQIATEGQYCPEHHQMSIAQLKKNLSASTSGDNKCSSLTTKGKPCRGTRVSGSDFCRDHAVAKLLQHPVRAPAQHSRQSEFKSFADKEDNSVVIDQPSGRKSASEAMVAGLSSPPSTDDNTVEASLGDDALEDKPASIVEVDNNGEQKEEDADDDVWSWSSDSDGGYDVDESSSFDNADEVEESEHLQHLREVYEVEEAEEDEEDEEEELADEHGDEGYLSKDTAALVLPSEWHWDMDLPERWLAALSVIETWSDLNVRVQAEVAARVKMLKHQLHHETVRASARVYEGKSVIGGTITGCVARLEAIRTTNPFAVLVEEASEVMEPLLFSCFSSSTVKLEMIGDHLQLQPSVMSRFDFERINKINISMFERLICAPPGSEIPSSVLSIQRRMRKNICDLTRGFYSEITAIEDHDVCRTKVIGGNQKSSKSASLLAICEGKGREVPGVLPNIFFWTHKGSEQRATVGLSRINPTEAHMTCKLVKYMIHCGVPAKSIAVLTPYKGQLMIIRKLLTGSYKLGVNDTTSQVPRMVPACTVSTVDRFQGDEADVVVISLVIDGKSRTPFVKLQNRMIVLLSRARLGMYIIGNKDYFGETRHWQLALDALEKPAPSDNDESVSCSVFDGVRIGASLPICCPEHRTCVSSVRGDSDIKLGFCSVICTAELKCSHPCGLSCHFPHLNAHNAQCGIMVDSPCLRHQRSVTCESVTSGTKTFPISKALEVYKCETQMEVSLPCTHTRKMKCHVYRDIEEKRSGWPRCTEPAIAPFIYPLCKHVLECSCEEFERFSSGSPPPCTERGEYTPTCGHSVTLPCHLRTEYKDGIRSYVCKRKIEVALPRCGHVVSVPCLTAQRFEDWTGEPCLTSGTVEEGHLYGPKDYSCKVSVSFVRLCGHTESVSCEQAFELAANPTRCLEEVVIANPECGHECLVKCSELAGNRLADALQSVKVAPPMPRLKMVKALDNTNYRDYGLSLQCSTEVVLERSCGHKTMMRCSDARRITSVCDEIVTANLPSCGHAVSLQCHLLPKLSAWQPWATLDLDAKQQQAIDHLQNENIMVDDCPVPSELPLSLKKHIKICRIPVRFSRSSTCGHEIDVECDRAFRIVEGTEKLPQCVIRVPKSLPCGHEIVVDCCQQSVEQRCDVLVEYPCWNVEMCNNVVKTKCSKATSDVIACGEKCQWTCEHGHEFLLPVCTNGLPSHCPSCLENDLAHEIEGLKEWETDSDSTLAAPASEPLSAIEGMVAVELTHERRESFVGRKLKLLARFMNAVAGKKMWTRPVFAPQTVLCFFELSGKLRNISLERFDPRSFSAVRTLNGMEVYEATQENLQRVCSDKNKTLVFGHVFTALVLWNPADIPVNRGKKHTAKLQPWISAQQRHGFDAVYQDVKGDKGGKLTLWAPIAIYPTHRVEVTPGNKDLISQHLPPASQLKQPAQIEFVLPDGKQSTRTQETTPTVQSRVLDADRALLQQLTGSLSPLYARLDVDYPWDGKKLVLGSVQITRNTERMLMSKLNFVPAAVAGGSTAKRTSFGGVNYLKSLMKTVSLADADLFLALEFLAVRKQEANDARQKLEAYVKAICERGDPAHPAVILAIVRLSNRSTNSQHSDIERRLLHLFCDLYPDAKDIWLNESEKAIVTRVSKSGADSKTVGSGFSSIEDKWLSMKEQYGCRSDAMDELLKLVGLRKVKQAAVNLFKNAMAFRQMPATKRARNVMALNYCFVGNPGTGKTTVARLFARILNDSGVRQKATFVECTAQKLKDDGADEFRIKLAQATDGVLFIDEAYELDPVGDFKGKPIVAELLTAAEDKRGELSIIIAGYEDDIQNKLYAFNDGLQSRFNEISFEDFDAQELETVWDTLAKDRGWEYEQEIVKVACRRLAKAAGHKGFGNARAVRKLFEKAVSEAMARDDFDGEMTFRTEDLLGERPSLNPKLQIVLQEVNNRIGWGKIKKETQRIVAISDENYARELKGQETVPVLLNRLFLGNPGTGKTTFAAYYGRTLKALNFLSNGDVVKKTAGDFIGSHVGESQTKTSKLLDMAKGKVLVIDEAYNLNDNMYGKQVLDVLVEKVQGTDSDDLAVILIGYDNEMREMLRVQNPGLRRRFPPEYAFHFEDYSEQELFEILEWNCAKRSVRCPFAVAEALLRQLALQKSQANFGNAGAVEQLLKHAMGKAVGRPLVDGMAVLSLDDVESESSGGSASGKDPLEALDALYRVDNIKSQLTRLRNEMQVAQREGSELPEVGHFVFRGSPGTGKTTVARVMAQILHEMGVLGTDKLVETSGLDLTGEFVGQTKKKVTDKLSEARGGLLFIDEAYELGKGHYGEEAMTTLVAAMTDPTYHGMVIIIAGYPKDIDLMLDRNAGLKSRFTRFIDFEDWEPQDAVVFLCDKADKANFEVAPDAVQSLQDTFSNLKELDGFGNGRDAMRMWKEILQCRAQRVVSVQEMEPTITAADVDMAGEIVLAGRRPPDGPLLSQSSVIREDDMLQLATQDQSSMKESTKDAAQEKEQERDEQVEAEPDLDDDIEDLRDKTARDPGVSDEDWEELERAKEEHAAHLADLKRRREEAKIEEERRKAAALQEKIRRICPCPAGFNWFKTGGGWRCSGGTHFVSDAQLQRQFTC